MQAAHTAVKSDVARSESRQQRAIEATERRQQASEGRLLGAIMAAERRQQDALMAAEGRLLTAISNSTAETKKVEVEVKASTQQQQQWRIAGFTCFTIFAALLSAFPAQIMHALAVALQRAL